MTRKSFLVLCVATGVAVALAAAALLSQPRPQSAQTGEMLVPNLVDQLDSLKSVVVRHAGQTVSLDWDGKMWRYRERLNYPADGDKVTGVVVALARMTKLEPKTRIPTLYPRLDLGDPEALNSNSSQVTLIDAGGKEIANVIIGRRKYALGGQEGGTYVRVPGDPQTWLALGDISVGQTPGDWLKRDIVDIKEHLIKRVTVSIPGGERVIVARSVPEEPSFVVESLPRGAELKTPTIADDYGKILDSFNFEDVAPVSTKRFPEGETVHAVIEGFDGFQFLVDYWDADDGSWVKLKGVPPETSGPASEDWAKTIAEINLKAQGWAFKVPEYQIDALRRHMRDLLK